MTVVTLSLVIAVALVTLWLVAQVVRLRRLVAAVPEDGNVFTSLQELDRDLSAAEEAIEDMRPRLDAVERRLPLAISHTGVVSYDAFGDIAGNLSRSIALLNDVADGVVVSLLVGRSETRFFTKEVRGGAGVEPLSPEEQDAIRRALAG